MAGLVSDRDLVGNGVEVEFFGEKTTLPGGAATLALRTGAPLLPVVVYSGPGDWHTGVVHPPVDTTRHGSLRDDVTRVTQELARIFEGDIRAHPEQWHLYQAQLAQRPGVRTEVQVKGLGGGGLVSAVLKKSSSTPKGVTKSCSTSLPDLARRRRAASSRSSAGGVPHGSCGLSAHGHLAHGFLRILAAEGHRPRFSSGP